MYRITCPCDDRTACRGNQQPTPAARTILGARLLPSAGSRVAPRTWEMLSAGGLASNRRHQCELISPGPGHTDSQVRPASGYNVTPRTASWPIESSPASACCSSMIRSRSEATALNGTSRLASASRKRRRCRASIGSQEAQQRTMTTGNSKFALFWFTSQTRQWGGYDPAGEGRYR